MEDKNTVIEELEARIVSKVQSGGSISQDEITKMAGDAGLSDEDQEDLLSFLDANNITPDIELDDEDAILLDNDNIIDSDEEEISDEEINEDYISEEVESINYKEYADSPSIKINDPVKMY